MFEDGMLSVAKVPEFMTFCSLADSLTGLNYPFSHPSCEMNSLFLDILPPSSLFYLELRCSRPAGHRVCGFLYAFLLCLSAFEDRDGIRARNKGKQVSIPLLSRAVGNSVGIMLNNAMNLLFRTRMWNWRTGFTKILNRLLFVFMYGICNKFLTVIA